MRILCPFMNLASSRFSRKVSTIFLPSSGGLDRSEKGSWNSLHGLKKGSHVGGITKHVFKRYKASIIQTLPLRFHALNLATPAIKVSHKFTLIFIRGGNFNLHDWLKQNRGAFCIASLKQKYQPF